MNEPPASRSPRLERWRDRLQRMRSRVRKAIRSAVPFVSGVIAALVAILLYNAATPPPKPLTKTDVDNSIMAAMASATPMPAYSAMVYGVIQPSLVLIQARVPGADGKSGNGVGTGVVVDDQAHILTALHVVEGARNIRVTFADGTESPAAIVMRQPENDIAVLQPRVLPQLLVPAVLGNPNAMSVGDEAFVVGNPFGLYGSMSAGVISGFERSLKLPDSDQRIEHLIQIDTAVNPGNSGGPLLNRRGEVVGIVTALLNPSETGYFIGIGFAVPITVAGGGMGMPPY